MSDIMIGLIDPKFAHNVGMAIRAASCYGAHELIYSGERLDLALPALSRLPREERMKGYKDVKWYRDDGFIRKSVERGYTPVCVERCLGSENLFNFVHPRRAIYVFGPEDGSVDKSARSNCHRFVYIPTEHCLNLATAVTTVLYDRGFKQFHKLFGMAPIA